MTTSDGIVGNGAILKAIDDEHRDITRAAQAIYDERMKPTRKKLAADRVIWERAKAAAAVAERAWEKAQAVATEAERQHDRERMTNVGEANRRRNELRQAVTSARPVPIATIRKMADDRKESVATTRDDHGDLGAQEARP